MHACSEEVTPGGDPRRADRWLYIISYVGLDIFLFFPSCHIFFNAVITSYCWVFLVLDFLLSFHLITFQPFRHMEHQVINQSNQHKLANNNNTNVFFVVVMLTFFHCQKTHIHNVYTHILHTLKTHYTHIII